MKWRSTLDVICKKVPLKFKGKFYCTIIRLVILYGTDYWVVKSQQENALSVVEMKMLYWMSGDTR